MTFEFKGAHPPRRSWYDWRREPTDADEVSEDTQIVAELRAAVGEGET